MFVCIVGTRTHRKGQFVDVAMTDCVMPLLSATFGEALNTTAQPTRGDLYLSGGLAHYNVYKCKDEKWIALGGLEPKFFRDFAPWSTNRNG